jgi:hypothetical protein
MRTTWLAPLISQNAQGTCSEAIVVGASRCAASAAGASIWLFTAHLTGNHQEAGLTDTSSSLWELDFNVSKGSHGGNEDDDGSRLVREIEGAR